MTPFLTNLLMFSPLLGIAALILYILDRAETLRRGAGLLPPEPVQPPPLQQEERETEAVEEHPLVDEGYDEELDGSEGEGSEGEPAEAPLLPGEPIQADATDAPIPGPQLPAVQPRDHAPSTRTVGAKKARSLARRDQRRAYHEFLQSQQSERRRQAEAIAEEEEERIYEVKRKRAAEEEEITKRKMKEKEERIEAERKRQEERKRDVEKVKGVVTARKGKKAWSLEGLAKMVERDEAWVREVLKLEGLVGGKEGEWRMITGEGWYVVVGEAELGVLYRELEKRGKMEWGEMARVLEEAVA